MKLTGNCKDEFEKWLNLQDVAPYTVMFWNIPEIVQNAYIIDFFDSVGIYIDCPPLEDFYYKFGCMINSKIINYNISFSRSEATAKAIEKANEIFNLKN